MNQPSAPNVALVVQFESNYRTIAIVVRIVIINPLISLVIMFIIRSYRI